MTVDAREDVKCKLFWSFNDDVLARWIPANHVVVFWALEETVWWQSLSVTTSGGKANCEHSRI